MYRSTLLSQLQENTAARVLPRVTARFNLNRYAEYVTCADQNVIDGGILKKKQFGRISYSETTNVVKPFRHAHGVAYPLISSNNGDTARTQPMPIVDMADNNKDRVMQFMPSSENTYRYYISSKLSGTNIDTLGMGYRPDDGGSISDIKVTYAYPDLAENDPFFVLQEKNLARAPENLYDAPPGNPAGLDIKPMFLNGNAVHFKFNTIYSEPVYFKVYVGWRPFDSTTTSVTETTIYDSSISGVPIISNGEVFSARSISNDGGYCKIELNRILTLRDNETVIINRVSNQVDGVYKIIAINNVTKTITIDAPFVSSETFPSNKGQIYSAAPGEFTLFMPNGWSGVGHWTEQETYWTEGSTNLIGFNYVRLQILSNSRKKAYSEVIEIMPALYADLTSLVENIDVDFECSSSDPMKPIGTVTSNSGSITFNNSSRLFDQSNYRRKTSTGWIGSPLALMLTNYVEVWIDAETGMVTNGNKQTIRLGTFLSETWTGDDDIASVELSDYAKIFQERNAPDLLLRSSKWIKDRNSMSSTADYKSTFENLGGYSVTSIISNMLAASGWTQVMRSPNIGFEVDEPRLKYFWCRQEQTIWEVLQDIAESTQTAIYFDRNGWLNIVPRNIFSDQQRGVEDINRWRFRGVQQASKLPDILSISREKGVPISRVDVKYNNFTSVREDDRNSNAVFWEPPENMQLRLAELKGGVQKGATRLHIKPRSNGAPFQPSGSIAFGNMSVDYKASAFFRTFGVARGAKGNSIWEKWWCADEDAIAKLKELNDGFKVEPANILYVENGLSGEEKTDSVSYPISDPEDTAEAGGFRIRYVIDGAKNKGGEIDGSQWRTFDRNSGSWIMNCRRSEFPRGIKLPANNSLQPNDQYLIALRDFDDDGIENLDRIIAKFQFIESQAGAAAGITIFNHMARQVDKFYAVKVKIGEKMINGHRRNEPIVLMHRIEDDGEPTVLDCKFKKETGTSIEDKEWCILELEVIKAKEGKDGKYNYEFNVYLNGFLIGTFEDKSNKSINPNTKAGFFVTNGVVEWDGFVAAEDGEDSGVKPKDKKKARKKLRGSMKKTHRKKKKEDRVNNKNKTAHNRGNKANKTKGKNKTRAGGGRRGRGGR